MKYSLPHIYSLHTLSMPAITVCNYLATLSLCVLGRILLQWDMLGAAKQASDAYKTAPTSASHAVCMQTCWTYQISAYVLGTCIVFIAYPLYETSHHDRLRNSVRKSRTSAQMDGCAGQPSTSGQAHSASHIAI